MHALFLFPAVATASRMSHVLQTQVAASPASPAGMGLSATSPALLAPLARAAGSSAPTAGLGRPASQTPGTVDIVTLAGWGPGEGASLLRVRVYLPSRSSPQRLPQGEWPPPATHTFTQPWGPASWGRLRCERWVLMGPWAQFSSSSLTTQASRPLLVQGSVVCHLLGLASNSRPCLHLSFTAEK